MTAQKKFPRLNLKRLWDTIQNLEVPNGKSQKKFHTAFVTKFKGLLFYFQFRISKVNKGGGSKCFMNSSRIRKKLTLEMEESCMFMIIGT